MKINLIIIITFLLLLVPISITNAQQTNGFISKEGEFAADFPDNPKISENDLGETIEGKTHIFSVNKNNILFSVAYTDFESLDPKLTTNKEYFIRIVGNGVIKSINGELLGAINTKFNDFAGRSFKINIPSKVIFSRLYYINTTKERIYQISVTIDRLDALTKITQDIILNFLNSFKLLDSNGNLIDNNQNNLADNPDPSSPKPINSNANNKAATNNVSNNSLTNNDTNSTPSSSDSDIFKANTQGVKSPQVLQKVKPAYSSEAKKNGVEGKIVLSAVFGKDGTITDIRILYGLGYGLDEEAVKAASLIKFTPGEKDGKPVNVRARLEFSFSLL